MVLGVEPGNVMKLRNGAKVDIGITGKALVRGGKVGQEKWPSS